MRDWLHPLVAQLGTELTLLGGFAVRVTIADVLIECVADESCYDIVQPFSRGGEINHASEQRGTLVEKTLRLLERVGYLVVDLSWVLFLFVHGRGK